jgi:hypothetical protein
MNQIISLFDEYVMKAITTTETMIASDLTNNEQLSQFTDNRERLLSIIDQISKQIDWNSVSEEQKNDLNRKIEYIKNLDVKLLTKLQEYQEEVRREIEQTFKQKENIKGYNLSDVK